MKIKLFAPLTFVLFASGTVNAAEYSVSNSEELRAALVSSSVQPGDTLYLRGGTYTGRFISKIAGAPGKPITVRSAPGEWAIIDRASLEGKPTLGVRGAHVTFRDLEITNSARGRVYRPGDVLHSEDGPSSHGINVRAPYIRIINCIIHDTTGSGIGLWQQALDSEVSGCIIYNIGRSKFHHGIYTNGPSTNAKLIRDNIIFNNVGTGITLHSAQNRTTLEGFQVEGNAIFNNGLFAGMLNWVVGTAENKLERVWLRNNYTFQSSGEVDLHLKYNSPSDTVLFESNVFAGGVVKVVDSAPANTNNNKFMGNRAGVWRSNSVNNNRTGRVDWQDSMAVLNPQGEEVVVRANKYQPGRANVIVYNWDNADVVNVSMVGHLQLGQRYVVVDAQNFKAGPVLEGTFNGLPLPLPMKNLTAAQPVDPFPVPSTNGVFNVFLVLGQ